MMYNSIDLFLLCIRSSLQVDARFFVCFFNFVSAARYIKFRLIKIVLFNVPNMYIRLFGIHGTFHGHWNCEEGEICIGQNKSNSNKIQVVCSTC